MRHINGSFSVFARQLQRNLSSPHIVFRFYTVTYLVQTDKLICFLVNTFQPSMQ